MASPSAGGYGAPELQRTGDVAERLESRAGAADGDVAETEHAAEQALLDIDALDLGAAHLDRVAADEARFVDDAPVGDGKLGRGARDRGPDGERQAKDERDRGKGKERLLRIALLRGPRRPPAPPRR